MKRIVHRHRELYGRAYGVWVIVALSFFTLLGLLWLGISFYLGRFVLEAFAMTLVFGTQLFLRNKVVNLVLGIFALLFSIWQLLRSITSFQQMGDNPFIRNTFIIYSIVSAFAIIMAGILIFSFLYAFKQTEKESI